MKFLALFFLSTLAIAAPHPTKKKINLKPPTVEHPADDTTSAEHLLYQNPQTVEKNVSTKNNPKIKATTMCKDSTGMVVSQGDSGYESCLRNVDKATSGSDPRRNSVGISIGH